MIYYNWLVLICGTPCEINITWSWCVIILTVCWIQFARILFRFFSIYIHQFSRTPWIAARQASLSITNSWSSLRFTSIESVMPSSHLILGRPLLLLPPIQSLPASESFPMSQLFAWGVQSTGVSASASLGDIGVQFFSLVMSLVLVSHNIGPIKWVKKC